MLLGWSADERSFFALTNERDPQFFDLYRYHFGPRPVEAVATEEVAPGFEREPLLRNPGGFDLSGVSRDGRWVALTKTNTNADSDVFLASVERPDQRRHVTAQTGSARHGFASFAPDASKLYYTTNEHGEFDEVWSFELASSARQRAFRADWDVAAVRANGVPVEYLLFPDEGHGFHNKENRIRASEAYPAFLETHLRGTAD